MEVHNQQRLRTFHCTKSKSWSDPPFCSIKRQSKISQSEVKIYSLKGWVGKALLAWSCLIYREKKWFKSMQRSFLKLIHDNEITCIPIRVWLNPSKSVSGNLIWDISICWTMNYLYLFWNVMRTQCTWNMIKKVSLISHF